MNHGFFLFGAIAAEILATTSLKLSEGFTKPLPAIVTVLGYGVSFYLLSLSLKRMDLGVVYAIWSGVGTAAMAVVGYWLFSESMGVVKGLSIAMIIFGVVGLNMGDRLAPGSAADTDTRAASQRL
ncbi:multidrug efflux SMR transporter [Curvibacter sp. APW13]|uniref:DMT family transporter n=1 Tax=Curvibacter sp. APW13 TaxID=3077236 RepID=UPI0028DF3508|nr:multidrug efflux SMR transporter [Curvibacter sp. APW13]MDT8991073.1 multidrug efflux SMR transporter [Curvibacter sp. APW13]